MGTSRECNKIEQNREYIKKEEHQEGNRAGGVGQEENGCNKTQRPEKKAKTIVKMKKKGRGQ